MELAIREAKARLSGLITAARKSRFSPEDVIEVLEDQEVTFLPVTMLQAARALKTPFDHMDPFDEFLLVQAQEEGLRLLTVDRLLVGQPFAVGAHELEQTNFHEERVPADLKDRLTVPEAPAEAMKACAEETNRLNRECRALGATDRNELADVVAGTRIASTCARRNREGSIA